MYDDKNQRTVTIRKDGSHWVAFREGFQNIMESPCGFGRTEIEAMSKLLIDEHSQKREPQPAPKEGA